jgi:hypothetical protein
MNRATHAQRIIELLGTSPGLDDDEIARKLAISPRQIVNQICRRLLQRNVITREPGPRGKVVNRLTGAGPAPTLPTMPRETAGVRSRQYGATDSFLSRDLARTLIVIPCSKSKQTTTLIDERGRRIADSLPEPLALELEQARARVRSAAAIDETTLIPAWERYSGSLYEHGRAAISDLLGAGAHIAIVSGGYGVALATEPIGMYEAPLKLSWWPQRLIARVLLAYAQAYALNSVRAFAPASSNYRKALTDIRWNAAGVEDALLLIPDAAPGGTRKSPASIGDALAALRDGLLSADWRSSYGLALGVA